jgi:rubrerythrin
MSAVEASEGDARPHAMCRHAVTVPTGPALWRCVACGTVIEKLPEPTGCEGAACES